MQTKWRRQRGCDHLVLMWIVTLSSDIAIIGEIQKSSQNQPKMLSPTLTGGQYEIQNEVFTVNYEGYTVYVV